MARGRGAAALAVPGVQADVVVIAARREEGGPCAVALLKLESHDLGIEGDGPVDIRDAKVDVPDGGTGIGSVGHRKTMGGRNAT